MSKFFPPDFFPDEFFSAEIHKSCPKFLGNVHFFSKTALIKDFLVLHMEKVRALHIFLLAILFLTRGSVATKFRKNEAEVLIELLIFLKFSEGQIYVQNFWDFLGGIFRMENRICVFDF